MGYKLRVAGRETEEVHIWDNFAKFINGDSDTFRGLIEHLHLYGAKDIKNTAYIEFDSEEDLLVFKLKFG